MHFYCHVADVCFLHRIPYTGSTNLLLQVARYNLLLDIHRPLWSSSLSKSLTCVKFFPLLYFTHICFYKLMLLHCASLPFLVVNTLPKLHTNDLFGWTSSLSKIALVLVSMVKLYFSWSWNCCLKYLPNQFFNGNMVILRILYKFKSKEKPEAIFFSSSLL